MDWTYRSNTVGPTLVITTFVYVIVRACAFNRHSLVSLNANILVLLLYILNTSTHRRNQLLCGKSVSGYIYTGQAGIRIWIYPWISR